jgi:hypothetical protein
MAPGKIIFINQVLFVGYIKQGVVGFALRVLSRACFTPGSSSLFLGARKRDESR